MTTTTNPMPRIVGETIYFTAHGHNFTVKRVNRDTWHLRDLAVTERSRFGNRQQIAEDMAYAETYGTLPPPAGPRW